MTVRSYDLIRQRLVSLVDEIFALHQLQRDPASSEHLADSLEDIELAVQHVLSSNERSSITRIIAALRRVDQGTYGLCASCSGSIGAMRLLDDPTLDVCDECAEEDAWRPAHAPHSAA